MNKKVRFDKPLRKKRFQNAYCREYDFLYVGDAFCNLRVVVDQKNNRTGGLKPPSLTGRRIIINEDPELQ